MLFLYPNVTVHSNSSTQSHTTKRLQQSPTILDHYLPERLWHLAGTYPRLEAVSTWTPGVHSSPATLQLLRVAAPSLPLAHWLTRHRGEEVVAPFLQQTATASSHHKFSLSQLVHLTDGDPGRSGVSGGNLTCPQGWRGCHSYLGCYQVRGDSEVGLTSCLRWRLGVTARRSARTARTRRGVLAVRLSSVESLCCGAACSPACSLLVLHTGESKPWTKPRRSESSWYRPPEEMDSWKLLFQRWCQPQL